MHSRLGVEEREGGLRVLTLLNAAKRNALDPGLLDELIAAFAPERASGVRAVLVRGEGEKAFCAGFDLTSLANAAPDAVPDEKVSELMARVEAFPAPIVALIHGAAFGAGCELAAACDFRVGADDALLCMPPAKLGVVYTPEGLFRMMALVGRARAKLMFLTGRRVDATTCLDWGLLDEVHPKANAEAAAVKLCQELASNAPLAVRGMKRAFALLARPELTPGDRGLLERLRREAFASQDVKEGATAFRGKRPPRFSGK